MSEKPSPLLADDEHSRDRLRAVLVLCCVIAVVLAGSVVPAISGGGLGQTPLGSVVPQPNVDPYAQGSGGPSSASEAGGLGALNPGDRTGVGGSLASNASAFRSQNAEVHFSVQSTTPSYWRTGAYDSYTGSGWEQSGDRRPYTGPLDGEGIQGQRVEYRVTLNRSATALPSVWRANSVSQIDADPLFVTDQRAFVTDDPLPVGTTYAGVSHLPPRDPTVLRTAGRDYPAEIDQRYTALPADADREVGRFTTHLVQNADSPYEQAKRVESWLEANKNYSLNVSEPAGDDVASQFIFRMEEGYCEYFATAMTVMLRSQGIPARYVVGYSTGQQVGENAYEVRAMNAHAWVEVYFPEVGWVRFDPTPGSERLEAEQRAFQNQTQNPTDEYNHTESGSPGEEFSPNESTENATPSNGSVTATTDGTGEVSGTTASDTPAPGGETQTESGTSTPTETGESSGETRQSTTTADGPGDDPDTPPPEGEYEVELNRTPVPGAMVQATVTQNGGRVTGVPVYFNGERVGVTDDGGTVTARVPYAKTLRITVGRTENATARFSPPTALGSLDSDLGGFGSTLGSLGSELGPPMALTSGPPPRSLSAGNQGNETAGTNETNGTNEVDETDEADETNETEYSLETNATLAVSGDVATGSEVVVTATVQDVPMRNTEVRIGDESVGTTDESGRIRVQLPDSPGNVTISVSRGSVSGEQTVSVPELTISVEPGLPLALPGAPVDISATYGDEPVSNATVEVADAKRQTDFNGSASVALPFRGSAAVVVSAHGQTQRTTVTGLFVNLLLVLGGAAIIFGGLGFGAYRRGFGPRRLVSVLFTTLRAIPGLAVAALFGVVDRFEWAVGTALNAVRELLAGETTVGELLERLRAWLRERAHAARESARLRTGESDGIAPSGRDEDSYRTLREAWHSFLGVVSVRRPDASTPGELAQHAVEEDGLPPDAVVTLRDSFRDVEYGTRSPADRLARVEAAVETIERTTRETEDGSESRDDSAPEQNSESELAPNGPDDETSGGET